MVTVPEGLNPKVETREIVFDADVSLVTPFLKLATVSRGGSGHMTFASDEGPNLGGLGSAPTPLMYFSAALAFWLMTQVSRYGHMLKVTVDGMRMRVKARYRVDGSVLNDTIQGRMLGAETTLEIDSPDPPERVAKVVRNAERGCFVMQALQNPVPVTGRTLLNGAPLDEWGRGAQPKHRRPGLATRWPWRACRRGAPPTEPAPSEPWSPTAPNVTSSVLSTPETEPDTAGGLSVEPYLAQRESRLFHARESRWAARIKPVDRVAFERVDDAEAQGLRRCPACELPG